MNLFLLRNFHIEDAHETEGCEVFKEEKCFPTNTLPYSMFPIVQLTHKMAFTSTCFCGNCRCRS
jgi:hypothetical protein